MMSRASRRCITLAALIPAMRATAQVTATGAPAYAVAGSVVSRTGEPVPDAEIRVIQSDARERLVRSDSAGRFSVAELTTPDVTLRVRRLGFQSRTMDLAFKGDERKKSVVVSLDEAPTKLATMSVLAPEDEPDAHLRDFYTRKATNSFGRYIEGAAIEKRRPQYLSEMLRSLPGVQLLPSRRVGNLVHLRGCSPLIWIDGVRLPGSELDEVVQPADVAAMEIYNSFAGIPPQFFDRSATCGTILVWLRTR